MTKKQIIKISLVIIAIILFCFFAFIYPSYVTRYTFSEKAMSITIMQKIDAYIYEYNLKNQTYPQTAQQLIDFSKTIPTEKDFFEKVNPYDKSKKIQLFDLSQPPDNNDEVLPDKNEAGNIFYYTDGANYAIYAVGEDNKLLRNKGRIFYLSNY